MTELPTIDYTVKAWVNVDENNFFGYKPTHPVAAVRWATQDTEPREDPFIWHITETGVARAAEMMFAIGNRMELDQLGYGWPSDIRSLSVGDLVEVRGGGVVAYLAVASVGYTDIPEPINPRVPIEGTTATSRETAS